MSFYENLVMKTQMNYSRYYPLYAEGKTPYKLSEKEPLPYGEQIRHLVREIRQADCVVVGRSLRPFRRGEEEIFITRTMFLPQILRKIRGEISFSRSL